MSNKSIRLLIGATALALAASSIAGAADAAGRNLANGGFPAPANGTAMFLNLAGGAHFQLGFSALIGTFYMPTNAAAVALAPYGLSLNRTPLPNPTSTGTSATPPASPPPPSAAPPGAPPPVTPVGPIQLPPPVIVSLPVGP